MRLLVPASLLLSLAITAQAGLFSLGYDFVNRSVDGRFDLQEWVYLGFKVDPGIHTDGNQFDLNLDGFARFPLIPIVQGLSMGPEGGMRILGNGDIDNAFLFGNFFVDMKFQIAERISVYGHAALASLQIRFGNNPGQDDFAFLTMGHPMELGFLLNF